MNTKETEIQCWTIGATFIFGQHQDLKFNGRVNQGKT